MSLFESSQIQFGFPLPLAEKYRPRTIQDFIGLEKQRKVLSAFAKRPVSCAWLLHGGSGLGKTSMALALFEEMQAEVHMVPSQKCNIQAIEDVRRICQYAPMFGKNWHGVLVDEIDSASAAAQLALLSKLDSTDPAPSTVWVFTSNNCERLEKRFLSRCRVMEFSNYGLRSDLAEFLARIWKQETGSDGSLNFERLAKESNSNVREALQALEIELLAA